jgi:anaerobic selenocysteine-containing dehydrogenase
MELTRRDALKAAGLTAGVTMASGLLPGPGAQADGTAAAAQMAQPAIALPSKLRIKQSVCRWCYSKIALR